jgi:hypothetical protein
VCAAVPVLRRFDRTVRDRGWLPPTPAVAGTGARTPLVPRRPWLPAMRVGTSAVVLVGLLGPLAMVAGSGARPSSFASVLDPGRRPTAGRVEVALPPVEIDAGVPQEAASFGQADAEQMASDLVVDLTTIAEATARFDGAAVDGAAAGSYRDQAKAHIDELRATGSVEVATYRFDRIRAVLVRVPGSGQNSPEIGLEAWGSVTREVRDGAEEPGVEPVTEPFRLTMRMAPSDVADRYLIAGPGEIWTGRP